MTPWMNSLQDLSVRLRLTLTAAILEGDKGHLQSAHKVQRPERSEAPRSKTKVSWLRGRPA
jgi:hypothetical protein